MPKYAGAKMDLSSSSRVNQNIETGSTKPTFTRVYFAKSPRGQNPDMPIKEWKMQRRRRLAEALLSLRIRCF